MQDILKKYRKHKYITNLGVIVTSLVLAFGINLFLIDSTQMGENLKVSILGATQNEIQSNIYFTQNNNTLDLRAGKSMQGVTSLSFSFAYNPSNLQLNDITSEYEVVNIENEPGLNSIIINFNEPKNIQIGDNVFSIGFNKIENQTGNINMFNANFQDISGDTYLLSTSGIVF